jgi:hypothetical protein
MTVGPFNLGVVDRDCMGNLLDSTYHKADNHIGLYLGSHIGQCACHGHGN